MARAQVTQGIIHPFRRLWPAAAIAGGTGITASLFSISRLSQHDFPDILTGFTVAFACYLLVLTVASRLSLSAVLIGAVVLRLSVMTQPPALSDDYHRFWWDSYLVMHGENPYLTKPEQWTVTENSESHLAEAQKRMNSASWYTVYPPVALGIWSLGHELGQEAMQWITGVRIIYLLFDIGTIILLYRWLIQRNMATGLASVFAWNPLVVMEGIGNLHPETIMIFFLVAFVQAAEQRYIKRSGLLLGLAAGTKLLPLIALPFLVKLWGWKKTGITACITALTLVILFIPFLNGELIAHLAQSLNLYFRHFEFNASLYFLVRSITTAWKGYNLIAWTGPALALLSAIVILMIAYRNPKEQWWRGLLIAWLVYLIGATTVHPWYILPLVALGNLSLHWWPVVWSFTVVCSYSHYGGNPSMGWITAEYILLMMAIPAGIIRFRSSTTS